MLAGLDREHRHPVDAALAASRTAREPCSVNGGEAPHRLVGVGIEALERIEGASRVIGRRADHRSPSPRGAAAAA